MNVCKSFFFLSRITQFDILDPINFLRVYDQLGVERIQLLCLFIIFSRLIVLLQRFVGKCSTEIGMAVFGL